MELLIRDTIVHTDCHFYTVEKTMPNEIDFDEILGKYHSDPYEDVDIYASHTGRIRFLVEEGDAVDAVSGEWKHIPGTALFEIN